MATTVIVQFQAKADQVDALKAFLSGLQDGVLAAGGLGIMLMQDQDDPTKCFEIERWPSAGDHKAFIAGAAAAGAFAPFDALLAAPFTINYLDLVKASEA